MYRVGFDVSCRCDVRCYIVYYILYYYILYYIIIYYTYTYTYTIIIYYYLILYSSYSSDLLLFLSFSPILFLFQSSHSFYTCRYLHILIYIPDSSKNNLTPHVLSEWMVEVCRFDKCGVRVLAGVSVSQVWSWLGITSEVERVLGFISVSCWV